MNLINNRLPLFEVVVSPHSKSPAGTGRHKLLFYSGDMKSRVKDKIMLNKYATIISNLYKDSRIVQDVHVSDHGTQVVLITNKHISDGKEAENLKNEINNAIKSSNVDDEFTSVVIGGYTKKW